MLEGAPLGAQSCAVDGWPGAAMAPEACKRPLTASTPATGTSTTSSSWAEAGLFTSEAAGSEGGRAGGGSAALRVADAGCATAPRLPVA
eukprot:8091231-Lingulodinium_polyedra.AAC.1